MKKLVEPAFFMGKFYEGTLFGVTNEGYWRGYVVSDSRRHFI